MHYKSLHDMIYLSCHYYVIHNTNRCMTKYIWVFIIVLYIIQIIACQNIFELSILCYTYYKSLHRQNVFEFSLLCYTYYKSLHDKIYLICHCYVMHTTNHCMTWYIWVVIIMLYIIQIIAWQNIFEFSLSVYRVVIIMLCIYKSLHDKIYLSCQYYVIHTYKSLHDKIYLSFHYLL